jgi:outer membrane protein TolC
MWRSLSVMVCATILVGAEPPRRSEPAVLTLSEALETALGSNLAVQAAALDVKRAERTLSATRTRYLPVFSLEAQAGQILTPVKMDVPAGSLGTLPGVGAIPPERATLRSSTDLTMSVSSSVSQPITQLFKVRQSERLARIAVDANREQLRGERAKLATEVKRVYYSIIAGQAALAAAEEQVATQRELARMTSDLLTREAVLEHEALQARSGLAEATLLALSTRNTLATAKEQLNRLLGRDVRTAFRVAEVPDAELEELDLDSAREQALRDRPEVRQARELVEKAEADRSAKRAEYLPDLSAFVSYTSYFNVEILPRNVAIAGLQLKWEGWGWGRRGQELSEKSLAVDSARVKARDAEQAVLVDVGERFRKLEEATAALESARLTLATLRAKTPVVEHQRRVEAVLLKDALQTRTQLAQAAHDHQQAILALWSARAEFEKALGRAP